MTNELTERISEMLREKNEEIASMRRKLYARDMEIVRLKAALTSGVKPDVICRRCCNTLKFGEDVVCDQCQYNDLQSQEGE
jgi:seryl-tRNA(Sec) selenium transferase